MKLLILALLSVFLYALYIRVFKKNTQYERELGPDSHKKKNGTITMGGIIFVIVPLFFMFYDKKVFNIAITIFLYGLIGFIDDLLIVLKKDNKGISPTIKLILQVIIAAFSFYLFLDNNMDTKLSLFSIEIEIKWLYGMLILLILSSSTNAFNLTDGIDGLCSGLSILLSIAFMYYSYIKEEYTIMYMILCVTIPLFVFWCFNFPKAFLFMGDTGSLYLGAFYGMLAIYLNCIDLYIILALIFIFETLSVILQVGYFKITKGKRLFKMSPFHHHLEECGLSEVSIDVILYAIQVLIIIICYYILQK